MGNKLYVGNLPPSVNDQVLASSFRRFKVVSAKVMMDRETGRSKGFGFVELETEALAREAVEAMNGALLQGQTLHVNEARPTLGVEGNRSIRFSRSPNRESGSGTFESDAGSSGRSFGAKPAEDNPIKLTPLHLSLQVGSASAQDLGELFHELSVLYQMMGGSGLYFSPVSGPKGRG